MQTINIPSPLKKFFCPFTGKELIGGGNIHTEVETLVGHWVVDVFYEADIPSKELSDAFDDFISASEKEDENFMLQHEELEDFLNDYKNSDWIVFKIILDEEKQPGSDEVVYLVLGE